MKKEAEEVRDIYKNPKPMMPLTPEESAAYEAALRCALCEEEFSSTNYKVSEIIV